MRKTLKKLIVVLCSVIILPVVVFAIYEVSKLSENEQELKTIYDRQLEAVLFSVNLHSQDLVNSTVSKLENSGALDQLVNDALDSAQKLAETFIESSYLECIHLSDATSSFEKSVISSESVIPEKSWNSTAKQLLESESLIIDRLKKYSKSGFRKLQPLNDIEIHKEKFSTLVFVRQINSKPYICTLFFNPDEFSEQVLVPKLQLLAEEDFELSILQNNAVTFSTADTVHQATVTKKMWLLPTHQLGISPVGNTLDDVINDRKRLNIISLVLLVFFIVVGVYIMFRNLQKEMDLAQQKSEFVSNVSHEIRTPLALISMFGETLMLGRVKSEEKKYEYYEIITKEAGRLTNIVNRILNFSKIEAEKKTYQLQKLDLNEVLEEVLYTYSFHIKNKGYTYELNTSDLPEVMADKDAIVEAVVNLIDNAMKYSPNHKSFTLKTFIKDNAVELAIIDQGIGIPTKSIPHLFDKFYRVPQGNIHEAKGSGLGLSIVKHIMDAHGGSIQVKSEKNKGSTFSLLFPIHKKELSHA